MQYSPVHWYEGVFLRPQHFQAMERCWAESVQASSRLDNHYNYGVRHIKISKEAVADFQLEVTSCEARMPDGTLVSFDVGEGPDRAGFKDEIVRFDGSNASLQEALEQESVVRVFLAIPRLKMGRANVASEGSAEQQRFVESRLSVPNESSGGSDEEIAFRQLNARILFSTQDLSGYDVLPIAQVKRGTEEGVAPVIDDAYFPPVLAIDAWPPLGRDVVRELYDFLNRQLEALSTKVNNRRINLASQDLVEVNMIFRLMQLNEACTTLRILSFASGIHPLVAYTELCRIVAKLAIFEDERRVPEVPLYDHDDLARIFRWVKARIIREDEGAEPTYEQRFFEGHGRGMSVAIVAKWLTEDWDWFVGVKATEVSREECRAWIETPGNLDWKLGSRERIDELWERRAPGLKLAPVASPPRILPSQEGWFYYEIDRASPTFNDVRSRMSLAMRFAEKYIQNLNDLQGKRDLVIAKLGQRTTLQFALFAVRYR